jgi:uncharacterized repeat protein (TIGR02543 family)
VFFIRVLSQFLFLCAGFLAIDRHFPVFLRCGMMKISNDSIKRENDMKHVFSIFVFLCLLMSLGSCKDKEVFVTVTFDSMGGTAVEEIVVTQGSTIQVPPTSRDGYTLEGWYMSVNDGVTFGERWPFMNTHVDHDLTLYAK